MASSLVRGKYVVTRVLDDNTSEVIEDGAVFQRDGEIVEVGAYDELRARHTPDEEIGSHGYVVVPGLINAHHHIGLTPLPARRAGPASGVVGHLPHGHTPGGCLPGHALLRHADD